MRSELAAQEREAISEDEQEADNDVLQEANRVIAEADGWEKKAEAAATERVAALVDGVATKLHQEVEAFVASDRVIIATQQHGNAEEEFTRCDVNSNGVLEGEEVLPLAEWIWARLHPGQEPTGSIHLHSPPFASNHLN